MPLKPTAHYGGQARHCGEARDPDAESPGDLHVGAGGGPATLRPYHPADFETLYAIDQECYPRGIAYPKRELRWFLRQPGACCLVACLGEEIAGFLIGNARAGRADESERLGHIVTLDVLARHRRRRIGGALVGEIERQFRAQGIARVELETAIDNQPAIAFWRACGYRIAAVIPRYYLNRTDAYYMVKALAGNPSAPEN